MGAWVGAQQRAMAALSEKSIFVPKSSGDWVC